MLNRMLNLKSKLIVAVIVILGVTVFMSCEKEDKVEVKESSSLLLYKSKKENPLEYIGIEHNIFMKEFMTLFEDSYKNHEWDGIVALDDKFSHKFSSMVNKSCHNLCPEITLTTDIHEQICKKMNVQEWYDGDNISNLDLAKDVLKDNASNKDRLFTENLLNDLFETIKTSDNDKEAFAALKKVLIKHENLILSENWDEKETYALGTLSVMKHSLMFWEKYDFSVFGKNRAPNWKNAVVVAADAAGYVIGGVTGFLAGVTIAGFTFGASTVGGLMIGKLIGAFSVSATAVALISVLEYWGDFFSE